MAEETLVADPPKTEAPKPTPKEETATTRIGDKYRETLNKLQTKEPSAPSAEKSPIGYKKETSPSVDKTPSPLDVASGDKKPVEKPAADDKAWEQEDVLKEFDPQKAHWQNARKTMGTQSLQIKNLTKEIETLKGAVAVGDPNAVKELESARTELQTLRDKVTQQESAIKAVSAEYSDEYQGLVKKYDTEFSKAIKRFESFAGKGTGDRLADALVMPN